MQPSRDRLVLERHPHRLDMMVGKRGVFGVTFALLVVVGDVGLVVLVIGPLRRAPMHRGHEEIVARGDFMVGESRGVGLRLAAAGDSGECRADVRHLLHPLADAGEVGIGLDAARPMDIKRARLVPIDAVGADDVVDHPALLVEAPHMRLAALIAYGRKGLLRAIHDVTLPRDFMRLAARRKTTSAAFARALFAEAMPYFNAAKADAPAFMITTPCARIVGRDTATPALFPFVSPWPGRAPPA